MLPFSAASELVEMLVEAVQRKVFQCVAAFSLSFAPVQMHVLFCCAFGGYPCRSTSRAHLHSAVFHVRLGSEPWA